MSDALYEPCPFCNTAGRVPKGDDPEGQPCELCRFKGFVEIGLTKGQVERMAALERACARCYIGDSGVDGPERFTVMRPSGSVRRYASRSEAIEGFTFIVES